MNLRSPIVQENNLSYSITLTRLMVSGVIFAWVLVKAYHFPIAPIGLIVFLLGYAAALWSYPVLWLVAVPALLPVMDVTPWSGRFFFDEFDLLLTTTLTVQWAKPSLAAPGLFNRTTQWLITLYYGLYGMSVLRGLWPFPALDANAFNNYYSHYNALRLAKGWFWALLLLPALRQTLTRYRNAASYWCYGVLLGLTGVIAIAIGERLLFTGLWDFSSDYRIHALFSSMHTGGGHIESYLMLSLPFMAMLFYKPSAWHWGLGLGLLLGGIYTLLVTFSRGGYISFTLGMMVLVASLMYRQIYHQVFNKRYGLALLLLCLLVVGLGVVGFKGKLIQQRFSLFTEDKAIRSYHWQDAINMMEEDSLTRILGMGVGSYPRTYFWHNNEHVIPATYKIDTDNNNPYLSLRAGDALFMGQYIKIAPNQSYRVQMAIRATAADATLSVALCEKSLLYAIRCQDGVLQPKLTSTWQVLHINLASGNLGTVPVGLWAGGWPRPLQFSLRNASTNGQLLAIDNIALLDSQGHTLLANGDFTASTDHWFFGTEKHHPWHVLNIWVHVLFDQGYLGLVVFILLLSLAFVNLIKNLTQHLFAAIFLSALCGFLLVSWVDSPFDAPRLSLLFSLTLFWALLAPNRQALA
jgi:O-Antigen ligase